MKILLVIGSRNHEGQTARAAQALAAGAVGAGAAVEMVFLTDLKLSACRQCEANGWGLCRAEGRCVIEDDFAGLVEKMRGAAALVVATPVYFSDLSESLKLFLDRLRRTNRHENGRAGLAGKPALGICVAGGGGGGAPSCAFNLDRILQTCGFEAVDLVPVRRQNLELKLALLRLTGEWLARSADGGN
ncbi:MAG TPA: flavodoxin family protein [bacterium]|uniref:NADPH-dependent FMN reductase n=1 Tax=candidate division TA06 bacterium ADurb.Bin417 TaxID=1852828 RepID=A0A1V5MDG4_UNCT6|nr:MAG: NADPH-dependent FMN reductase [candidate division TA06 bacterium ADurb.Bin417]HNQ35193.1 flavodoxin family protein [bacterium]HNS48446.1 flavodoxin family protein [bacterium]